MRVSYTANIVIGENRDAEESGIASISGDPEGLRLIFLSATLFGITQSRGMSAGVRTLVPPRCGSRDFAVINYMPQQRTSVPQFARTSDKPGRLCIYPEEACLTAIRQVPSIKGKRVTPHVIRHATAMNILHATGDIRKVSLWLGHANIKTTEGYLRASPAEKLAILERSAPPSIRPGSFPGNTDSLMEALGGYRDTRLIRRKSTEGLAKLPD